MSGLRIQLLRSAGPLPCFGSGGSGACFLKDQFKEAYFEFSTCKLFVTENTFGTLLA